MRIERLGVWQRFDRVLAWGGRAFLNGSEFGTSGSYGIYLGLGFRNSQSGKSAITFGGPYEVTYSNVSI